MATVRLKTNLISGGKFYRRDELIDEALVPEHLRGSITERDTGRKSEVLALHDLNFQTEPQRDSAGIPVSYPMRIARGQTVDPNRLPAKYRETLVEGVDILSDWSSADQDAVLASEADDLRKHFSFPQPYVQVTRSL